MSYFFTSESVSEGHPDKVSDQISDAVLDQLLAFDPQSKVACETMVTTGQVIVAGEVRSQSYVNIDQTTREVISRIGYNHSEYGFDARSCGVLNAIHDQSDDINRGVVKVDPLTQGAGDQGIMFGFATNETPNYMPLTIDIANALLITLADVRKNQPELMNYLRPDSKSQVTIEYDELGKPLRIDTIVLSTQHDEFILADSDKSQDEVDEAMRLTIENDIKTHIIPMVMKRYPAEIHRLFEQNYKLFVNPTGKFVIGGPHGDTGLTGRKIIVDTYGGRSSHGGGAFSGKDPSKVDRSATYAARHIAKNIVAAGVCDEIEIQISYAIGVAEPLSIYVNSKHKHIGLSDEEIAQKIGQIFDLRPYAIEKRLKLRNPIYSETAAYGHFGRDNEVVTKTFKSNTNELQRREVELFTWEKLDYVNDIKKTFNLQ